MALPTPGSFARLMDGLTAVQALVPAHPLLADQAEPLHPYRWRPDTPDLPAMWNWLDDETAQQMDTRRLRDVFVIETRLGQRYTDASERLATVELYVDAYRDTVDPYFRNTAGGVPTPPPMGGTATWAERRSMRMFSEDFGSVSVFGIAITQEFWLDRSVS